MVALCIGSRSPGSAARGHSSAAGDEGHDDVGGVAVEVLAATVVDRGGSRVGVAGGELHVAERDAGVEGGHDERRSKHVRVHDGEPGAVTDRTDPAMRGAAIKTLPVTTLQDRSLAALADGQVDRSGRPRDEWDRRGLVSFADDAQRPMSPLEPEILDVGGARFAHAQTIETEQDRQRRVLVVVLPTGEQEQASSERSRPRASVGCTCGRRTYCAGLDPIRPSMWAKR